MRIGFAGTPAFAATALAALLEAGQAVVLVLTRPDRPHGRGLKTEPGPVKALALAHGLPLLQPPSLNDPGARAQVTATSLDVLVVAAYGLLLPAALLAWPRHGCLNIHASLLPRWRGAAPIQRALLAGDRQTGVSIMRIDEGLDTGPVIARHPLDIAPRETGGSLHDKLASAGGRAVLAALEQLERDGELPAQAQPEAGATYAAKIAATEQRIDWRGGAEAIDRRIRAFNPVPGAQTTLGPHSIKLWEAEPWPRASGAPGVVIRADASGILVACGEGALNVTALQRAGARRLGAESFLRGHALAPGTRFGGAND